MDCQEHHCAVPVGTVYATLSNKNCPGGRLPSDIVPMGIQYAAVTAKDEVREIVNPADNQHGFIIRTCSVSGVGTQIPVQLFADTVPPEFCGDGNRRMVFIGIAPPSVQLPYQLHIPAGHGLWIATIGQGSVNISYDFLGESVE